MFLFSPNVSWQRRSARSRAREMARKRVGRDVVVRGVPDGQATSKYDDLGGLVLDAGSCGNLPRERTLGENVHEKGGDTGVLTEKSFDLVQGR